MDAEGTRLVPSPAGARGLSDALVRAARRPPGQDLRTDVAAILESAADAMQVERASVWRFEADASALSCLALFERSAKRHSSGGRIEAKDAPAYFAALASARVVAAHDARADPRTREFERTYLDPLGIASMLDAPVRLDGRLVGVVCHEHLGAPRVWSADEQAFAAGIGDLVAQAIRADELRRERDLARTLLQAQSDLGEGVALVGPDRRLLYVNDALARILGFTVDEMLAMEDPIAAVTSERSRALWEARTARLTAGLPVEPHIESFVRHKSGADVPVEIVGINVSHPEPRGRLFLVRDLTERRRRESSARLLDTIIQGTTDAVVTADPDGRVLGWNPGAERLFGWTREEILGRHIRTYFPPELHDEVGRLHALNAGRHVPPYETERLHKDGRRIPVSVNLTPVHGPDGRMESVTAILRDRSSQKALEDARRRLAQSEKLSALGSLVSGVAHEIRTPLTYLLTNLHLADRAVRRALETAAPEARAAAMERVDPALDAMRESVDRINRLVEDLRRYTRLNAAPAHVPSRLDEVVRPAIEMFRATNRGILTVEEGLAQTPRLALDALEIQQVVLNLLQNAAEAAPRDGVVRIRTRATDDGGAVLEVEDRGAGMPADVVARVFDAFFTTKRQGTGLGLSIVKRIVDAHGGTIRVDSAPGEGTRVTVTLPQGSG